MRMTIMSSFVTVSFHSCLPSHCIEVAV
jgi:hypothetical protein